MTSRLQLMSLFRLAILIFGIADTGLAQDAEEPRQSLYFTTVAVNGISQPGIYAALETPDDFYLDIRALDSLGLVPPIITPRSYRTFSLLPLLAIPGLSYEFDTHRQHLDISCAASCFPHHQVGERWRHVPPDPTPLGMFLNYDLSLEIGDGSDFGGGLAELSVFSERGTGNATFVGRDLTGNASLTRLETTWTIDFPDKRLRLDLGDSVTRASGWGRPVRFAGIRFGTDFNLQPGFITFPTPTVSGTASLPSTADIFVNDVKRSSLPIDPGPFTIQHLPIITGAGNMRVVVRDLLGRETVLMQPFYANRDLLTPGLASYSASLGMLRKNYGTTSNDYEEPFIAGSFRKGLSQSFTAGMHLEGSTQQASLGPFIDWKLPFGGQLSTSTAVSFRGGNVGGLLQLDASWSSQTFGIFASHEMTTADFTRLGESKDFRPARSRSSANIGFEMQSKGSISVNYTRVDERDRDDFEVIGATYSVQLGKLGGLGVNFSRRVGAFRETSLFISFTTRLGARTAGNVTMEKTGRDWAGTTRINQNAPYEGGLGYRAEIRQDDTQSGRAGVTYDSPKAIASLDVSHWYGRDAARLGLKGGLVILKGDAYLSRPVRDSFALVSVGNFAGVDVMQDNRVVTKTNKSGHALVTGLRAYEENRLSIDPLDLPLSADIGKTSLRVVPKRRSGVSADFPVQAVTAALFHIVDEDGNDLPPGSRMHAADDGEDIPIGFRGMAYVSGLQKARRFFVHMPSGSCTIDIQAISASIGQTVSRPVVCKRIQR
ncbi:fimbria/pilus outer membrane usher protein [Kordiimonas lipolytica]|uniref:Fimbria/pilus outer membrane usher protein n=1 Tax=Kordiimonas lipolytica TaxID=1662421 RepID=A0ABV8UD52_9PROT|nr:fimbria/pilus outer membrane usher protein [Kordiimonas lipolytica]